MMALALSGQHNYFCIAICGFLWQINAYGGQFVFMFKSIYRRGLFGGIKYWASQYSVVQNKHVFRPVASVTVLVIFTSWFFFQIPTIGIAFLLCFLVGGVNMVWSSWGE